MMSARRLAVTLAALSASTLAACGGGGGGTTNSQTVTGVFVDAPVANLRYETATQSGTTDAQGRYSYMPGETVTFSIGAIDFPPVAATGIVSPMTVFGVEDPAHSVGAVNLARLLQSLDADGNTSNGITIDAAAHDAAATASVNFEDDVGFEDAVTYVVTAARGETATLVSGPEAIAHLEAQFALVGAWVFGAGWDAVVFTFLASGQYAMAHAGTADDAGQPGSEFGTYTWSPETGAFTADAATESDTNGGWGFSHPNGGAPGTVNAFMTVSGTSAVLFDPRSAVTIELSRVYDAANPIVGSWAVVPDSGAAVDVSPDTSVLTFLADGAYALASGGPRDPTTLESAGVEFGTYEWDPSGAFTAHAGLTTLNTDGEAGFVGADQLPNPTATITIDAGIMSMGDDTVLKRIGRK
jgi:hypothetical protein